MTTMMKTSVCESMTSRVEAKKSELHRDSFIHLMQRYTTILLNNKPSFNQIMTENKCPLRIRVKCWAYRAIHKYVSVLVWCMAVSRSQKYNVNRSFELF